jgi:hypothetical protein
MNNLTLTGNHISQPSVATFLPQTNQDKPILIKFVCMAVGHQPQNIGNRQTVGTYPGTRKQVYLQHRMCKRCNSVIKSIHTVVDHYQDNQ